MRRAESNLRLACAASVALSSLIVVGRAEAHSVGLSRGEYTVVDSRLEAKIVLSRGELASAVSGLDGNHDGTLDEGELAAGKEAITRAVVDRLAISSNDVPCSGALTGASLTEQDGVDLEATYTCVTAPGALAIEASFLDDLPRGHRHVVHVVSGAAVVDDVLHSRKKRVELRVDPKGRAPSAEPKPWRSIAGGFFLQGIEHILTGYDHLAFLFGLILVRGRLKSVLAMVTAFTLAHSVTLALAVLGVFAPSPSFTEPAIALSVAYVGVENFIVKDVKNRWRITAPFGFIHGFGFAGALGQIALPRPQLPLALFTFNLGVEAGQLGVLALALPLVMLARRAPWFERWGVKVLSAAIVALGLVWFVSRIIWPPA